MYEQIKKLVQEKSMYVSVGVSILICVIVGIMCFIFQSSGSSGSSETADYNRTINAVERIESQQQRSLELNQSVQTSIERSAEFNREAVTRIERIEKYQQGTSRAIDESTKGIDNAERLLERNQQIFNDIERGHQEKP